MEAMRATLRAAGYPGTRDLEETVLYPGPTRFGVLEFLLGWYASPPQFNDLLSPRSDSSHSSLSSRLPTQCQRSPDAFQFFLRSVSGGLAEGHFGFAEAKREGEEAHLRSKLPTIFSDALTSPCAVSVQHVVC
jgi:hypothetical protein